MPFPTDTSWRKRLFYTAAAFIGVAVVWYFGIGDHTPSRQDAERFLAWGLDNGEEIVGFRDSGEAAKLTAGLVGKIDEVECHRDPADRKWFQRWQTSWRYACIYRLAGSDSAKYLTLISAVYSKAADHADVGNYGVGFLDEFRQREELAKYGLRPLWPY
jgi:hypothetical protein